MKKILLLSVIATFAFSLTGCKKYKNKEVYANCPVYMDYASFRNSFSFEKDVAIGGAGNIFVYNQYIFLSEEDKGIHIINNSNPAAPVVEGFMNIPGNTQMAVKGTYLYANSYIDMLVIDLSNITNPTLVNRMTDVFEYATPAIKDDQYPVADVHKDKGVVIGWDIEKTKEVSGFMNKCFVSDCPECEQTEMTVKSASSVRTTLSGSMSKWAVFNNNYLYVLDNNNLMSFNIQDAAQPAFESNKPTYLETETLFEKDGYLYVGTTTGMRIYNAQDNPEQPEEEGSIDHADACDPVFIKGDYAYLTIRSGTDCGGVENELQVIDISKKSFPKLEATFDMTNPHGLALHDDLLFLCDGEDGLKVFNAHDPLKAGKYMMYHFPGIQANDIILNDGLAIMVGDHGIYQYDYTFPNNMQFVSALDF